MTTTIFWELLPSGWRGNQGPDHHFPQDTTDEEWLRSVGAKKWIVLTKDSKIRYRPNEVSALEKTNVVAVVLVAGNLTGSDMADLFVIVLREIERISMEATPPPLFTFGRDQRLKQMKL